MQAAIRTVIRSAILALSAAAGLAQAADLTIRVDDVASNDGQVMVALYDSQANFLKRPLRAAAAEAMAGSTTVTIKDLPPGEYSFAVYHDANSNGRMDRNAMGIPLESYAFSNNAQGTMGPPAYEAAKFTVPASGASVGVTLR